MLVSLVSLTTAAMIPSSLPSDEIQGETTLIFLSVSELLAFYMGSPINFKCEIKRFAHSITQSV
jgi:hypothetical protein